MRQTEELRTTGDSRVFRMLRRVFTLGCSYCRPHRGENRNWNAPKPDKYKNKRR